MHTLLKRAVKSALSRMGEGSFLRGDVPCQVHVEHGVQLAGEDDTMVVQRDVATIDADLAPKVGDTLAHPDGSYKLDVLLEDRGAYKRFVLLKVPA